MTRGSFSPGSKAKIYAWDNAVCAFTGGSLWVLDHGASPLVIEEWADHIRPARRRGTHDPSNGIATSAEANWTKGANGRDSTYLFVGGQPTWAFYSTVGKVPEDVARRLMRDVQPDDWYFNRCLANLMWAVAGRAEGWTGARIKGDPMHYPKAAFRFLRDWRRKRGRAGKPIDHVSVCRDWRKRGLLPRSLSGDQRLLLEIVNAESSGDVDALIGRLIKHYRANARWLDRLDRWTNRASKESGRKLLAGLRNAPNVSPPVKEMIRHNVKILQGLPRARDSGIRDVVRRSAEYE